jgi:hypothetical protein
MIKKDPQSFNLESCQNANNNHSQITYLLDGSVLPQWAMNVVWNLTTFKRF